MSMGVDMGIAVSYKNPRRVIVDFNGRNTKQDLFQTASIDFLSSSFHLCT